MVVVAVLATGGAWLESLPPLRAPDAVTVAEDAFAAAGVDAAVDDEPSRGTYRPADGDEVAVWEVRATVEGTPVALWVARDDGQAVFLDDRTPAGDGQVLTKAAVTAIASHSANPVRDRRVLRNVLATIAAALVIVVVLRTAAAPTPGGRDGRGRAGVAA